MAVKEAAPVDAKAKGASADALEKGGKGGKGKGGKKSKKKLIIILLAVLVLGGGGYVMFLKPKAGGPPKPPEPGAIVKLDPININLKGTHFLKLGIALQTTKTAKEPPEGSAALDSAITLYTGKSITELSVPKQVQALKAELLELIKDDYEGDVMGIYFTQFVMQ